MAELIKICEQGSYHFTDLQEVLQAWEQEALPETGRSDCQVISSVIP